MHLHRASVSAKLWLAVIGVIVVMSVLACTRWWLWSYGSDTGTFAQVVWNVPSGFTDKLEPGGTHFRTHWSPILALLWPLIRVTRSPLSLQIAQVLLIALTAVPLYRLVERSAGAAWGLRCAWLCLLYPPLLANAFAEFHELAFYPVLALSLICAADRARWAWFIVFALLLVLVREDASLDVAIIGIALTVLGLSARGKTQRGLMFGEPVQPRALAAAGSALMIFAAGSLALYAGVVLPRLGPWAPSHFYQYSFARGPLQTALSIFTHPVQLIGAIATRGRLTYILEAFVPLALLPLLTPWTLLALPAFAGILLSSDQSVWRMGMHYVLLWAPWMVLAASWALVRIAARSQAAAVTWWRAAIALCIIFLIAFNPMHPAHYLRAEPYQHSAQVVRSFACVPRDAVVVTHDEWFAHEAIAHPNSSEIPDMIAGYRGYIVYGNDWESAHFLQVKPQIEAGLRNGTLVSVCRFGTVSVVRTR